MSAPLEKCCPIATLSVVAHTRQRGGTKMAGDSVRRGTRRVERLSQAEAVSGNSRVGAGGAGEAAGATMAGDICHAWLLSPLLTMDLGDQPVVSFFWLPSFPGTLLSLTMALLSTPRFFFFLPTFNPSSLLLFLSPLSVSTRKQNKVESTTVHSPLSPAVFHYDFSLRLCLCSVRLAPSSLYKWLLFVTASETLNRR